MPTTTELREYIIADGHVDEFVAAWQQGVVPLREGHGFRIDGAWLVREERRFVWLLSLDADADEFIRRNKAYYQDPARSELDPDPAQWIVDSRHTLVEPVR